MYYIKKYEHCWAIHNDDTGNSRRLTDEEIIKLTVKFKQLLQPCLRTLFIDQLESITDKP